MSPECARARIVQLAAQRPVCTGKHRRDADPASWTGFAGDAAAVSPTVVELGYIIRKYLLLNVDRQP